MLETDERNLTAAKKWAEQVLGSSGRPWKGIAFLIWGILALKEVPPTFKIVLISVIRYILVFKELDAADAEMFGQGCAPDSLTHKRLAEEMGCSKITVKRALLFWRRAGALDWVRNRNRSNHYVLKVCPAGPLIPKPTPEGIAEEKALRARFPGFP